MLRMIDLSNVGPARSMRATFAERLNLLTGDNGLGKSFLLDVAWWAMTRAWPRDLNPRLTSGYPARPRGSSFDARILTSFEGDAGPVQNVSAFDPRSQRWLHPLIGPRADVGIVIYAHAEGGFSVWDPARNHWDEPQAGAPERLKGYSFTQNEVWDGLRGATADRSQVLCNGLLADWTGWIRERGDDAARMQAVLRALSPEDEGITLGPLVRMAADDARDVPSLNTAYAEAIPILHASSGLRRILGLAYMLVWARRENRIAAELRGQSPSRQVFLMIDEVEAHLHPRWQRTILPSLARAVESLGAEMSVQSLVVTHSPVVMAAAEPLFDARRDAWLDFDLVDGRVELKHRDFVRQGTAGRWLTTEAFHLASEGRSLPAETVIARASAVVDRSAAGEWVSDAEVAELTEQLGLTLPEFDEFRTRWEFWRQAKAGSST